MSVLQLHYKDRLANLYDVGYLSVDLFQLIAFAQALEAGDKAQLDRWYGEKAHAFNRFAGILVQNVEKSRIIDARPGSVHFEIAVAGILVPVVCTLLNVYLQHHLDNRDCQFTIESNDPVARRALDMYSRGMFGRGPEAIEKLSEHLANRSRSLTALGDNAYLVDQVLQRYAHRIVRTVRRP